jgi:phospholipase C
VVIYQENHSFDNLYGRWEGAGGLRHAPRARTIQVNQAGIPYQCLLRGRQRAICLLRRRQAMVTP